MVGDFSWRPLVTVIGDSSCLGVLFGLFGLSCAGYGIEIGALGRIDGGVSGRQKSSNTRASANYEYDTQYSWYSSMHKT